MQLPVVMATRAAAWACLVGIVSGSPTINFPVNAQVPPVARLSQTFSFVFAGNTFTSTSSNASMTYALDSAPSWLSLESSERWLHGTPEESDIASGDVVGIPFGIIATDSTGSTALNVTLVVSRDSAPTVDIPISKQLADSGLVYSEPSSILSYPDTYFSFTFSRSTFSNPDLNYYAVSSDNSPLPSWINFDSGKLMFSGTTPTADSLIEPPETFNFQLIASDVTGFAAASVSFSIVVGSREVTADDPSVLLNATVGKELVYKGLQQGIKIDGQVAGPTNLTAKVLSTPPSWLTFDTSTWALSGTPPSSAHNAAFAISFYDSLLDTVNVTFQVDIDENGTVFRNTLPSMQARRGSEFSLNLSSYLVATDGVEATVETDPKQDWLTFNDTTLTLSGDVPTSQSDSSISVSVRATLNNATESETFLLQITGSSATTSASASSLSPTAASTSTSTSTATAPTSKKSSSLSKKEILMAVLIPTMLLAFVLLILACCMCYRRRRNKSSNVSNKDISEPVPSSFAYRGEAGTAASLRALEKEYNVNNVNSVYAQQQRAIQEKEQTGVAVSQMPVGTALALSSSDEDSFTKEAKDRPEGSQPRDRAIVATDEDGRSEVLNFPAPPSIHHRPGQSVSSTSSGTGAGHSIRDLAAVAAAGQWPFEESTLKSVSVHSNTSSHGDEFESVSSNGGVSDNHDALGIYRSAGSSSARSNQNSTSVITRQTVRTSTPMQMDAITPSEIDGRISAGLRSEHMFASQEAIVLDEQSASAAGTVLHHDEMGTRSSIHAVAEGTRSTMEGYHTDMEAGIAVDGADTKRSFLSGFASRIANRFKKGSPLTEAGSSAAPTSAPGGATSAQGWSSIRHKRFSSAAGSGYPSPDAPSFDTDVGSVTFGNITTAQPYKPRPVFIGSVNRINEESPQPNSPMWGQNNRAPGSSGTGATSAGQQARRPSQTMFKRQQPLSHMGNDSDDDDYEDIDGETHIDAGSNASGDEAIRLDPPRPAFLGPSNFERDATTDLSQDIASSLRSRRPTSGDSGSSSISAAMEEVRSLLLLTESMSGGDAATLNNSRLYDNDDGASDMYGYARSSNSWETMPSSEPNWTSMYEYRMQGGHGSPLDGSHDGSPMVGGVGRGAATATDAGTNEPPTPATGTGIPYAGGGFAAFSKSSASSPAQGSFSMAGSPALSVAQHQARSRAYAQEQAQRQAQAHAEEVRGPSQQSGKGLQIRTVAASPAMPNAASIDTSHPEHGLSFAERKFRHTSSFYSDEDLHHHPAFASLSAHGEMEGRESRTPASTNNEYEYPTPFVASDGGSFKNYKATGSARTTPSPRLATTAEEVEGSRVLSAGSGNSNSNNAPSIGVAVSQYSSQYKQQHPVHKHSRSRSISVSQSQSLSQPQLHQTQASLVSTASSGIRAFI
ncbi:transmembrane glycoprotein [Ophiostoma piceae UAMH 11346]|uniref:Transmembrane glycoprotein n=1 Tax=Ophiostoma piceae (strain UAMH 11346) TaxID=1262450 RepID=S3C8N0_OPHP1|nr:transmembrane glycoprotein [Ophiostoma piceae UAMH 11346]